MMTIAFAVRHTDGSHAVFVDRGAADRYVATCRHAVAVKPLVSRDAVDRKLDAYVPADQVSSLRWRVVELEECVRSEVEQRGDLLCRVARLDAALSVAVATIDDMLADDDGQAWREAEVALPALAAAQSPGAFADRARRLAVMAEAAGLVLTIERVPSGPPRMGGHVAEISVRPSLQALRKSGAAL